MTTKISNNVSMCSAISAPVLWLLRRNFTAALALRIDYVLGETDESRKENEESDKQE